MAKKKDDIDRQALDYKDSGSKKYSMEKSRKTKVFPDKAYDPMKLFRQRLADDNNKDAPRHMQREDEVVEQEYNYPGDKKDRYKHIKDFLRTMNLKK